MTLLSSWLDSLKVCKPRNFISFLKQAYHVLMDVYRKVLIQDWWLLALIFIMIVIAGQSGLAKFFADPTNTFWIFGADIFQGVFSKQPAVFLISTLLIYFFADLIISSKPEAQSGRRYFRQFEWQKFYYLLWFFMLPFVWKGWKLLWTYVGFGYDWDRPGSMLGLVLFFSYILLYVFFIAALNLCFGYFLFDSDGTLKDVFSSFSRGLKMVVYNLPFFLLMGCLLWLVGSIIVPIRLQTIGLFQDQFEGILWANIVAEILHIFLLLPLLVSIGRQFYIQKSYHNSH